MSKKLMITGLAQETDFADIENAKTVLVINNGELRIPIDESSVQKVLEYVLKSQPQHEGNGFHRTDSDSYDDSLSSDEKDALEKLADEEDESQNSEESEELIDEAGIPQL